MNPYFWVFAIYALAVTPVEVTAVVRIDRSVRWKMRLRVAGMPLYRRRREEKEEETLQAGKFMRRLFSPGGRFLSTLVKNGTLKRLLKVFRWQYGEVFIRLSFEDAACTALYYSLLRTALETLGRCGVLPLRVAGRIEADFQAQGTQAQLKGIFSARLGTLVFAGMRLGVEFLRVYARLALEEDKYAASH